MSYWYYNNIKHKVYWHIVCFCRSQIEKLESEKEELQKDLKLIESSSNQARNEKACENLGELGRRKRRSSTFI